MADGTSGVEGVVGRLAGSVQADTLEEAITRWSAASTTLAQNPDVEAAFDAVSQLTEALSDIPTFEEQVGDIAAAESMLTAISEELATEPSADRVQELVDLALEISTPYTQVLRGYENVDLPTPGTQSQFNGLVTGWEAYTRGLLTDTHNFRGETDLLVSFVSRLADKVSRARRNPHVVDESRLRQAVNDALKDHLTTFDRTAREHYIDETRIFLRIHGYDLGFTALALNTSDDEFRIAPARVEETKTLLLDRLDRLEPALARMQQLRTALGNHGYGSITGDHQTNLAALIANVNELGRYQTHLRTTIEGADATALAPLINQVASQEVRLPIHYRRIADLTSEDPALHAVLGERPPVPEAVGHAGQTIDFQNPNPGETLGEFLMGLGFRQGSRDADPYFYDAVGVTSGTFMGYGVRSVPGEVGYLLGGLHYANGVLQLRHDISGEEAPAPLVDPMDLFRLALNGRGTDFFASTNPDNPREIVLRYPHYWDTQEWQYGDVGLAFALNRLNDLVGGRDADLANEISEVLPEAVIGGTLRRHRLGRTLPHHMFGRTRDTLRHAFASEGRNGPAQGSSLTFFLEWMSALNQHIPVYDSDGIQLNNADAHNTDWRIRLIPDNADTSYVEVDVGRRIPFAEPPFSNVMDGRMTLFFDEMERRVHLAAAVLGEAGEATPFQIGEESITIAEAQIEIDRLRARHERYTAQLESIVRNPQDIATISPGMTSRLQGFYGDVVRLAFALEDSLPRHGQLTLGEEVLAYEVLPARGHHVLGVTVGEPLEVSAEPILELAHTENWEPSLTHDVLETFLAIEVLTDRGQLLGINGEVAELVRHLFSDDPDRARAVLAGYQRAQTVAASTALSHMDSDDPYVQRMLLETRRRLPLRRPQGGNPPVPVYVNPHDRLHSFLQNRHGITNENLVTNLQRVLGYCLEQTPDPYHTGINDDVLKASLDRVFPERGREWWQYNRDFKEFFNLMGWRDVSRANSAGEAQLTTTGVTNLAVPRYIAMYSNALGHVPAGMRIPFHDGLARMAIAGVLDHYDKATTTPAEALRAFAPALEIYNDKNRRTQSLADILRMSPYEAIPVTGRQDHFVGTLQYEGVGERRDALINLALNQLTSDLLAGQTVTAEHSLETVRGLAAHRATLLGETLTEAEVADHGAYVFQVVTHLQNNQELLGEATQDIGDPQTRRMAGRYFSALMISPEDISVPQLVDRELRATVREPALRAEAATLYQHRLSRWVDHRRGQLPTFENDFLGVMEIAHTTSTATTREAALLDVVSQGRDLTPDLFRHVTTTEDLLRRLDRHDTMAHLIGDASSGERISEALTGLEAQAAARAAALPDPAAAAAPTATEISDPDALPPLDGVDFSNISVASDEEMHRFFTELIPRVLASDVGHTLLYEHSRQIRTIEIHPAHAQEVLDKLQARHRDISIVDVDANKMVLSREQFRSFWHHDNEGLDNFLQFLNLIYESPELRDEARYIFTSLMLMDSDRKDATNLERYVIQWGNQGLTAGTFTPRLQREFQNGVRGLLREDHLAFSAIYNLYRHLGSAAFNRVNVNEFSHSVPVPVFGRAVRVIEALTKAGDISSAYAVDVIAALSRLHQVDIPSAADYRLFAEALLPHWEEAMQLNQGEIKQHFSDHPSFATLDMPEVHAFPDYDAHKVYTHLGNVLRAARGRRRDVPIVQIHRDLPFVNSRSPLEAEQLTDRNFLRIAGAQQGQWTNFLERLHSLAEHPSFHPGIVLSSMLLNFQVVPKGTSQGFVELVLAQPAPADVEDAHRALEAIIGYYRTQRPFILAHISNLPPAERPWWAEIAQANLATLPDRMPDLSHHGSEFPVLRQVSTGDMDLYLKDLTAIRAHENLPRLRIINERGHIRDVVIDESLAARRISSGERRITGARVDGSTYKFQPISWERIENIVKGRLNQTEFITLTSATGEILHIHPTQLLNAAEGGRPNATLNPYFFLDMRDQFYGELPMVMLMGEAELMDHLANNDPLRFKSFAAYDRMMKRRVQGRSLTDVQGDASIIRRELHGIFRDFIGEVSDTYLPAYVAQEALPAELHPMADVILHPRAREVTSAFTERELWGLRERSSFANHFSVPMVGEDEIPRNIHLTAEEKRRVDNLAPGGIQLRVNYRYLEPAKRGRPRPGRATGLVQLQHWGHINGVSTEDARRSGDMYELRSNPLFLPANAPLMVLMQDPLVQGEAGAMIGEFSRRFADVSRRVSMRDALSLELRDAVMELYRESYIHPAIEGETGMGQPDLREPIVMIDGKPLEEGTYTMMPAEWALAPREFLQGQGVPEAILTVMEEQMPHGLLGNEEIVAGVLRANGLAETARTLVPRAEINRRSNALTRRGAR